MRISVKGLTCANCAGKIECALLASPMVAEVEINVFKQRMKVTPSLDMTEGELLQLVEDAVHQFEPDVVVSKEQGTHGGTGVHHSHREDGCCNETDHDHAEGHDHAHDGMDKKQMILRFGGGFLLFLGAVLGSVLWEASPFATVLFLIAYGMFGYDVLWRALKNIRRGQVFDENFLMSISTIGAIAIGEMPEAVFVMLFYQVGEAFQAYAVEKSRKSITALLDIRPEFAEIIEAEGRTKKVNPEEVQVGQLILVKAGQRIPLDGKVVKGQALLDTATLTGEALPQEVKAGSAVLSGCINLDGSLEIEVTKVFGESTVVKILEMVENADGKKSKTERFITRFARIYTPVVVALAVLLCVVPPLLGMGAFETWLGRGLIFLVVSCPCALVLSVPLTYFAGIGAASKEGILVKGGGDLDTLCHIHQVVFDKTGTITKGEFSVVERIGEQQEQLLTLAAIGEAMSNHPIAKAIVKEQAKGAKAPLPQAVNYKELGGLGISYDLDGRSVLLGNARLLEREKIAFTPYVGMGTVVYVAYGGVYQGALVVADTIKEGCETSLEALRKMGVSNMVMLTGDRKETAAEVAKTLGLDQVYSELLPQDKVTIFESLKNTDSTMKTAFVGDGINDAPVLAGADLGIAMGGLGADAAIEAADVVIMEDDLGKLAVAIRIAKNTRKIVGQNIVFALGIKAIVLVLSAVGFASMWMAVFADVGVSVLAVLNAMRRK